MSVSNFIRNSRVITLKPSLPLQGQRVRRVFFKSKESWLRFRVLMSVFPSSHFFIILFSSFFFFFFFFFLAGQSFPGEDREGNWDLPWDLGLLRLGGIAVKCARVPGKRCLWYRSSARGGLHWYDFDVIMPHMFPLLRCPVTMLLYVMLQNKAYGYVVSMADIL